jgi:hypothetical protein
MILARGSRLAGWRPYAGAPLRFSRTGQMGLGWLIRTTLIGGKGAVGNRSG